MKNNFDWFLEDTLNLTEPIITWQKNRRPVDYSLKTINPGPKSILVRSEGWIDLEKKLLKLVILFLTAIPFDKVHKYP